jgi:hypothetical protein
VLSHIIDQSSNVVLALATIALAVATIALARWTKTLSRLTERLVKIEDARDDRESKENRRRELAAALEAAKQVQLIPADDFARALKTELPLDQMKTIEALHSFKRHIDDPECHQHLDFLCMMFDSCRREKDYGVNVDDIAKRVRTLQERIQWFVDKARAEVSGF